MIVSMAAMAGHLIGSRKPDEVIGRGVEDTPYMERWFLQRAGIGGCPESEGNRYIHRFLQSDAEDPHCHPWDSVTTVLKGAYEERCGWVGRDMTPAWGKLPYTRNLRAGDRVARKATDIHAILRVAPGTVTLFETGPKVREWGFYTEEGFVHHKDYRRVMLERRG
jgi:hypothetical protein